MVRRSVSIDEKIAQRKQVVFQAKEKYETAVVEFDKLIKQRDELRRKELLVAFTTSSKSFNAVISSNRGESP